jgi:surface antigen
MLNKMSLLLATVAVVAGASAGYADPFDHDRQNNGPNDAASNASSDSERDQTNYRSGYNYGYDDANAQRQRNDRYRSDTYRFQTSYQRGAYYYGNDCQDNAATGTIIGAVAGGLVGNQFGHGGGRTAATVGGVILGGMAGNSIASDMNCSDRRYAMSSYGEGFEGQIGHRYDWRNDQGGDYGSFTPVREYSRDGNTCRDFRETSYRSHRQYSRSGTACRRNDGNWYLE